MEFKDLDWKTAVAVVFGFGGWILSIVQILLRYKADNKPAQKITCREVSHTSLVRIQKDVLERIEVSFDERPVQRLGQIDLELFNSGTSIISSPVIRFEFPRQTVILSNVPKVKPIQPPEFEMVCEVSKTENNIADLKLPYLNPRKDLKTHITLSFVCDGNVQDLKIIGGGEGWSVNYVTPEARNKRKTTLSFLSSGFAGMTGLFLATLGFLSTKFLPHDKILVTSHEMPTYLALFLTLTGALLFPLFFVLTEKARRKPDWYDHGEGYRPRRKYWTAVRMLSEEAAAELHHGHSGRIIRATLDDKRLRGGRGRIVKPDESPKPKP